MSDSELQREYSGAKSQAFWARISKIPVSNGGRQLYSMGCLLQEVENRVLRELEEAEKRRK